MKKDTKLLRNPQGTEGLLLEEALSHLKMVNQIEDQFLSWGYLPSKTPAFDYYDIYKDYLNNNRELFRLMDRDGELLVLRSDITLFLAKQLGMTLAKEDLPVRIFYSDSILRYQNQTDISKNEFFQMGAELVGVEGMRGDAEILAMMSEILTQVGVPTYCHIGSRDFFNQISQPMSDEDTKWFSFWIKGREYEKTEKLLSSYYDKKESSFLASLFSYIGCCDDLILKIEEAKSSLKSDWIESLDYLLSLFKVLQQFKGSCQFKLDLSEIGNRSYYTGVSFNVYAEGADSAVASGGRYDKLLEQFGFASPSTGFSILIRKLEQIRGSANENPPAVRVEVENIQEALDEAGCLRAEGKVAIL